MSPNTWSMLCHLAGLLGYASIGLGGILGPLVVWILKKDEMPQVDHHGKEALNFNLSIFIYGCLLVAFTFVTLGFGAFLAVPLWGLLVAFHIVCVVLAALAANRGEAYRYPFTIRIVR